MRTQTSQWVPERLLVPTVVAVVVVGAIDLAKRLAGIAQILWIDELATASAE